MLAVAGGSLPFIAYVGSLSSAPGAADTAELQAAAYVAGIAHPTGFPLYLMLGWVWSHTIAFGSVAWRLNLFSAACVAATCAVLGATARALGAKPAGALGATLTFAFAATVWAHGSYANTYTLTLMWLSIAQYYAVRACIADDGRALGRAGFFVGLGLATHPIALWALPGLLWAAFARRRRLSARTLAASALAVAAPLACYAYLPLRSLALRNRAPTVGLDGANSLIWNYNDPASWTGFVRELSGAEYHAAAYLGAVRAGGLPHDIAWWLQLGDVQIGMVALLLAGIGVMQAWRSHRAAAVTVLLFGFAPVAFTVTYSIESDQPGYVLLSIAAACIFAALAPTVDARAGRALSAFLLVNAAFAFGVNSGQFARRHDAGRRAFVAGVRRDLPTAAAPVLVTSWPSATALAYAQTVDGDLPGVIVVSDGSARLSRFARWRKRHRVFLICSGRRNAAWLTRLPSTVWLYEVNARADALAPRAVDANATEPAPGDDARC